MHLRNTLIVIPGTDIGQGEFMKDVISRGKTANESVYGREPQKNHHIKF